jgi:hypothetical protein
LTVKNAKTPIEPIPPNKNSQIPAAKVTQFMAPAHKIATCSRLLFLWADFVFDLGRVEGGY